MNVEISRTPNFKGFQPVKMYALYKLIYNRKIGGGGKKLSKNDSSKPFFKRNLQKKY